MDAADIRDEALALYAEANHDPELPPGTVRLALSIFGEEHVRWVPGLEAPARLISPRAANDRYILELRHGLSPAATEWHCAHELGEYRIEVGGWSGVVYAWREYAANAIAAVAMAPDAAIRRAVEVHRWTPRKIDLRHLAQVFALTQTIALLRLGEALDWPVAVINLEPLWIREPLVRRRGAWPRALGDVQVWRLGKNQKSHGYRTIRLTPYLAGLLKL